MKKYKLIKKYPGSPKLNDVIVSPLFYLEKGLYSEFWQEIVEKDYKNYEIKRKIEGFDILKTLYSSEILRFLFKDCVTIPINNTFCKVKQLLFTTEDGVDIFEGDKYFRIVSNFEIQQENAIKLGEHIYKSQNIIRFSTKEAAEEYILMNKPCLSINDVLTIQNFKSTRTFNIFRNLVKSRLTKM